MHHQLEGQSWKAEYARTVHPAMHDSIAYRGQAEFHGPVTVVDHSEMAMTRSSIAIACSSIAIANELALCFAMKDVVQTSSRTTLYSRSTNATGI